MNLESTLPTLRPSVEPGVPGLKEEPIHLGPRSSFDKGYGLDMVDGTPNLYLLYL